MFKWSHFCLQTAGSHTVTSAGSHRCIRPLLTTSDRQSHKHNHTHSLTHSLTGAHSRYPLCCSYSFVNKLAHDCTGVNARHPLSGLPSINRIRLEQRRSDTTNQPFGQSFTKAGVLAQVIEAGKLQPGRWTKALSGWLIFAFHSSSKQTVGFSMPNTRAGLCRQA